MNAGELLANTARSLPGRVAWIWDDTRTRTYAETNARTDAFARALTARGLVRGERVALLLDNQPEVMEAMFGCWKAGLAVAPLNARFTAPEIRYHVGDAEARVLVCGPEQADTIRAIRHELGCVEWVIQVGGEALPGFAAWEDLMAADPGGAFESVAVAPDELAWLAYTSGTTGRAKGAMLTHGVLVFEVLCMLADFFPLGADHIGMHAAPLTHGSGHVGLVFAAKGASQVILSRSGFKVERFLELVERQRVAAR